MTEQRAERIGSRQELICSGHNRPPSKERLFKTIYEAFRIPIAEGGKLSGKEVAERIRQTLHNCNRFADFVCGRTPVRCQL